VIIGAISHYWANVQFSLERMVWITANIEMLDNVFTQNPDEGDRHFIPKLHDQLKPCLAAVKQLAAEIMWLLMLCPSNVSPDKKRENIKTIWDWSERPFPDKSKWLSDAVLQGIGSGGPGFSNHRPRELAFCLKFLLTFRRLANNEQASLAKEPWNFAAWIQQVPVPRTAGSIPPEHRAVARC